LPLPRIKRIQFLIFLLVVCIAAVPFRVRLRSLLVGIVQILRGKKTVAQRVRQYKDDVDVRLLPLFQKAGVAYPPKQMILVGLKSEKMLEVWASDGSSEYKHIQSYRILATSGKMGPKLREGDAQVPEGLYRIESLNPNSLYHLSLRLNYPNEFDREMAKLDGRGNIGSDIMIHGKDCSIGCLAMGDTAAEDLFILAALAGIENVSVIIAPLDFCTHQFPADVSSTPKWTPALYKEIESELTKLKGKS